MELRHLRFFVTVADTLNFTRAAEVLNTAQPSLSQQIRQLESYLGRKLFERSSRSVRLTAAGEAFLTEARLALAQVERAVTAARQAPGSGDDKLVVGYLNSAEASVFPDLLPKLRARHPELEISLRSLTSRQQLLALQRREIDVGFMRPPVEDKRIKSHRVLQESIWLVVANDHPLAARAEIHPHDLDGLAHVGVNQEMPGLHNVIRRWTMRHGLKLRSDHEAENVLVYMSMVRLGFGVGLLPDFAIPMLLQGLTARPIVGDTPLIDIVMAYREDNHHSACTRFVEACLDILGDAEV